MSERIEGVPVGTKLVRIGVPLIGEWIIGFGGGLIKCESIAYSIWPIIAPENVYGVVDLAAVPIPYGYERDGATVEEWFRQLTAGDSWASAINSNDACHNASVVSKGDQRRIILRNITPKTKRVVILESDDPKLINIWASMPMAEYDSWSIRFEERPIK